MRKRIIKAGVLAAVFIAALLVSSLLINRGTDDKIVDMGAPALPRVSFFVGGTEVNPLFGYTQDMDITAMRDTIVPLGTDGSLKMRIQAEEGQVDAARYEVYSLNGEDMYTKGEVRIPEGEAETRLDIGNILSESNREAVLKVILTLGDDPVSYYTRIALPDDITTAECLAFAQQFHEDAMARQNTEEMESYLEPGDESDNTTYQTVNIHSDINHIQWGELSPEVVGDVEWSIKESNTVYTSILAVYQVSCRDEDGRTALCNVREFFRVRSLKGTIYLLDYNRDMEQIFSGGTDEFSGDGILFGIASGEIPYRTNKDGTVAALCRRGISGCTTASAETDPGIQLCGPGRTGYTEQKRPACRPHHRDGRQRQYFFCCIRIYERGFHEGEVGVGIYYFSADSNVIEEQALSRAQSRTPSRPMNWQGWCIIITEKTFCM